MSTLGSRHHRPSYKGRLKKFHLFAKLPEELRRRVWSWTFSGRQISIKSAIIMGDRLSSIDALGRHPYLPVVSQVNRESRSEVLHHYRLIQRVTDSISFAPRHDTVTVDIGLLQGRRHLLSVIHQSSSEHPNLRPLAQLQHLRIERCSWTPGPKGSATDLKECLGPLQHFYNLKEITFVNQPGELLSRVPARGNPEAIGPKAIEVITDFFVQMRKDHPGSPLPQIIASPHRCDIAKQRLREDAKSSLGHYS